MRPRWLWLLALLFAVSAAGGTRSAASKYQFRKLNPCPSTGEQRGACPGHVVDHIVPLCAGGQDTPENMQWQTVAAAKKKDIEERRQCRN